LAIIYNPPAKPEDDSMPDEQINIHEKIATSIINIRVQNKVHRTAP